MLHLQVLAVQVLLLNSLTQKKALRSRETWTLSNTAVGTSNLASHGKQTKGTEENYKDHSSSNSVEGNYAKYYWNSCSCNYKRLATLSIEFQVLLNDSRSCQFVPPLFNFSHAWILYIRWPTNANSGTWNRKAITGSKHAKLAEHEHVWTCGVLSYFRQLRNAATQAPWEIKPQLHVFNYGEISKPRHKEQRTWPREFRRR